MFDVSKPQGLLRRGGVWYYRRRIPLDLIQKFGGKRELKESLGTSDHGEAKIRRNRLAAKFEAEFAAARGSPNTALPVVEKRTNGEALELIRNYVARENAKRTENYLSVDWANQPDYHLECLTNVAALVELYKDPSNDATVEAMTEAGEAIFRTSNPLEYADSWGLLHRAVLELERRRLARLKADYQHPTSDHLFADDAVEAKYATPTKSVCTLAEIVGQYRKDYEKTKSVGEKRLSKVSASLELIVRFFGSYTPINEIDRKRCRDFRDLLNELPSNLRKHFPEDTISLENIKLATATRKLGLLARDTQDVYFNEFKRLLNWAKNEGHIERNPADDLFPLREKIAAKEARHPFTSDHLKRIFNAPLYRGSVDDNYGYATPGPTVHRGTRFWIPLIALFSGMRLNEICQLDVGDIRQSKEDVWFFSVNADATDKRLKNHNSKRSIPIHPTLIKIGFLDFVSSRKQRSRKLFPDLLLSKRGYYSERMSRWFDESFLPKVGAKTDTTSFHSFRHSFRDSLRVIDAPPAVVEGLGGWKTEEGVSSRYGSGLPVEQLATWMERIRYEGLDLSYLFTKS